MSIKLTDEQYEFIKGEVVALYERYRIRKIPINAFSLAQKMDIKLVSYSSLDEEKLFCAMKLSKDGFYIEDQHGENLIYYNDMNVPNGRVKMTILHEIGHCVLDHIGRSPIEEAEAAFFAKYAIAPPPLVNLIHPNSPDDIERSFRLSNEASIISFSYYQKWIFYSGERYKDYETKLLTLFNDRFLLKGGA